jgi:hypothetical protein
MRKWPNQCMHACMHVYMYVWICECECECILFD